MQGKKYDDETEVCPLTNRMIGQKSGKVDKSFHLLCTGPSPTSLHHSLTPPIETIENIIIE